MLSGITISVIIPVRNGEATLAKCLSSISDQTIANDIEIIILDSASTDNSKKIAENFGAKIINIPNGTFNHGLTRNIGVQYAQGNLLYYTVQDAWLFSNDMLEKMALHFNDDEVAGVVGQQVTPWGHLDKNPAIWFKRYTKPEVETRYFPNGTFDLLPAEKQFELCGWDNVVSMYRKSALVKVPFRETNFCEDWFWANDALHHGLKLLRDPALVTYHYHHMYFGYIFKTKFIVNYQFFCFFNHLPAIPWSPIGFFKTTYTLAKRKELSLTKKIYWCSHNFGIFAAVFLSTFIFRASYFIGGKKGLDKTYKMVCKQVPQAKVKLKRIASGDHG